jgi:hypothetical protein
MFWNLAEMKSKSVYNHMILFLHKATECKKSTKNGLKTGKWIQTETWTSNLSQQEDTKRRKKLELGKSLNDRLLSKENIKKQLPCD